MTKQEEMIILEKFHKDLDALNKLYEDDKISDDEFILNKAKLALNLTKPKETA